MKISFKVCEYYNNGKIYYELEGDGDCYRLNTENDLDDFIKAVSATLQYWLAIHKNPEVWACSWLLDGDPEYTLQHTPVISNTYFYFDVLDHAIEKFIKEEEFDNILICRRCEDFVFFDWEHECSELDWKIDHEELESLNEEDKEEAICWLKGFDYSEDSRIMEYVFDTLKEEGFKAYREGIEDYTSPIEEEIEEVIDSLESVQSKADLLSAILWGIGIWHVHGEIIKDYGERYNLRPEFIDTIREEGIGNVFGNEYVKEWTGLEDIEVL